MQVIVQCQYEENMTVPAAGNTDGARWIFWAPYKYRLELRVKGVLASPQKGYAADNFGQLRHTCSKNVYRTKHQTKKNPTIADRVFLLLRITSLTITYFHTGCSTIIGAKLFHGP
ncbi:hypothetical protein LSO07_28175, partial [Janthinobacterium sp. PLB04]